MNRFYYKCPDCLSVIATETRFNSGEIVCACQGKYRFMGEVFLSRIVHKHETPICDGRCTHAAGPTCDCQCGGVNHGTGLTVTVIRDAGGIPRVSPPDPQAIQRGIDWRLLKQTAREAFQWKYPNYGKRISMPQDQFNKASYWEADFRHISHSKLAGSRVSTLNDLIAELEIPQSVIDSIRDRILNPEPVPNYGDY